jgi:phage-related protein
VPRTITAVQTAAKNVIADPDPWLLLVQIDITGIKTLAYDGQTVNFNLGCRVTGGTSGAIARIIADADAGATGTLTIYEIRGTFEDDEAITDNGATPGVAVVNGTISASNVTYRYARDLDNVTWDGETWTKRAIEIEVSKQSAQGVDQGSTLRIGGTDFSDAFTQYLHKCRGLKGEAVTIRHVYGGDLTEAAVITEEYIIAEHAPGDGMAELTLITAEVLFQAFPRRSYNNSRCEFQFEDADTCQYASTAVSCGRALTDCITLDNVSNFGGFPGIPGEEFE